MSEQHAVTRLAALDEMAAEVDRLNAASGRSRFYLGAPENALADYTVLDRTLAGQPEGEVVARYFGLEAAVAEVERRSVEAAMQTYLAIRASGDVLSRAGRRAGGPSYVGIAAMFVAVYLAALVAVLALTAAGVDLAHQLAGWMR